MQICYDYQVFAAQKYGGISRYFTEIAWRIQQFPNAKRTRDSALVSKQVPRRETRPDSGYWKVFPKDFARATGFCLRLDAIISKAITAAYHPDIVHETYYSAARTVKPKCKTVITVYDTIAELFPDPPSSRCRKS